MGGQFADRSTRRYQKSTRRRVNRLTGQAADSKVKSPTAKYNRRILNQEGLSNSFSDLTSWRVVDWSCRRLGMSARCPRSTVHDVLASPVVGRDDFSTSRTRSDVVATTMETQAPSVEVVFRGNRNVKQSNLTNCLGLVHTTHVKILIHSPR